MSLDSVLAAETESNLTRKVTEWVMDLALGPISAIDGAHRVLAARDVLADAKPSVRWYQFTSRMLERARPTVPREVYPATAGVGTTASPGSALPDDARCARRVLILAAAFMAELARMDDCVDTDALPPPDHGRVERGIAAARRTARTLLEIAEQDRWTSFVDSCGDITGDRPAINGGVDAAPLPPAPRNEPGASTEQFALALPAGGIRDAQVDDHAPVTPARPDFAWANAADGGPELALCEVKESGASMAPLLFVEGQMDRWFLTAAAHAVKSVELESLRYARFLDANDPLRWLVLRDRLRDPLRIVVLVHTWPSQPQDLLDRATGSGGFLRSACLHCREDPARPRGSSLLDTSALLSLVNGATLEAARAAMMSSLLLKFG